MPLSSKRVTACGSVLWSHLLSCATQTPSKSSNQVTHPKKDLCTTWSGHLLVSNHVTEDCIRCIYQLEAQPRSQGFSLLNSPQNLGGKSPGNEVARSFTALFYNIWTLLNQFKGCVFRCRQSLESKGHVRGLWLVDFDPFYFIYVFIFSGSVVCRSNYHWWQWKTQWSVGFWTAEFAEYFKTWHVLLWRQFRYVFTDTLCMRLCLRHLPK